MTLARIREQVDDISETWLGGTPAELHNHLADLDDATAALNEPEPDTPDSTHTVDELIGRIEVLMDEIDINLGIEPPPPEPPDVLQEFHIEGLSTVELEPEDDQATKTKIWRPVDPTTGLIGTATSTR